MGQLDVLKNLIDAKADIEIRCGAGNYTVLQIAARYLKVGAVKLLHAAGAVSEDDSLKPENVALRRAVAWGREDAAEALIMGGVADINCPDHLGHTPLYHAAANGRVDMIKLLINEGADCTIIARRGGTVLHRTAQIGPASIVSMLIEAGADIHALDEFGNTPLYYFHRGAMATDPEAEQLLTGDGVNSLAA